MNEFIQKVMKSLESFTSEELNEVFSFVADTILNNKDFAVSIESEHHRMLPVIERVTGKRPEPDILTDTDRDIYGKIIDAVYNEKLNDEKLKELLAEIIASDTLFEGFCLNFYGEDDELEELCEQLGGISRLESFFDDGCFVHRRKYARKMADYAVAAAGFYGALHFNDLIEIIYKYEDIDAAHTLYQKTEGHYKNTIFFTPEYFFLYTLKELVSGISRDVFCTVDGYLLNLCYEDQFMDETEQYMELVSTVPELNEEVLGIFFNVTSKAGYRKLLRGASAYEMYIPPKKKLFKYIDAEYSEETKSETRLRRYMKDKYRDVLAAVADERDCTIDDFLDDVIGEFKIQETEEPLDIYSPEALLEYIRFIMGGFGINIEDVRAEAELADFIGAMINDLHKWIYHGRTAGEAQNYITEKRHK